MEEYMEKIDMLIDTVEELFLTGVTMEHDEEELLELLDCVCQPFCAEKGREKVQKSGQRNC
jgi:hypothetical protein